MDDHWLVAGSADLKLDVSRLKGDPVGGDTKYAVALAGALRTEWVQAWREVLNATVIGRRFEIDPAAGVVRFTCRNVDGTGMVFDALERLEALVSRANEIAAARRAEVPRSIAVPSSLRAR
jgi:hypothetical protein